MEGSTRMEDAVDVDPYVCHWTLDKFVSEYNSLSNWLAQIYGAIYGKEQKLAPKSVRMMEAVSLHERVRERERFTDEGRRLLILHPDCRGEIQLRLDQLNAKWETLDQALAPRRVKNKTESLMPCEEKDVWNQVKCLRDRLTGMEFKLEKIGENRIGESREVLEEKLRQHAVIQADIQSQGTAVSSIVKFSERCSKQRGGSCASPDFHVEAAADDGADEYEDVQFPESFDGSRDSTSFRRAATSLERRWHRLWLRSLELQCLLEERIQKLLKGGPPSDRWSESDRDEEPLSKYPRLTSQIGLRTARRRPRDSELTPDTLDGRFGDEEGYSCPECSPYVNDSDRPLDSNGIQPRLDCSDFAYADGIICRRDNREPRGKKKPERRIPRVGTKGGHDDRGENVKTSDAFSDCLMMGDGIGVGAPVVAQHAPGGDHAGAMDVVPRVEPSTCAQFPSHLSAGENTDVVPGAGTRGGATGKRREVNNDAANGKQSGADPEPQGGVRPAFWNHRDKCSPGKLCGSQWTGPNCASFHFKDVEADSENEENKPSNNKRVAEPMTMISTTMMTTAAVVSTATTTTRPKLVARVSPRRRLEMGYPADDDAKKILAKTSKEWWAVTSSDSDWLNTEGLSDSDGSGFGCEEPAHAAGDSGIVPARIHSVSLSEGGQRDELRIKRSCSKHSIHRLVNAADEMVRRDGGVAGVQSVRPSFLKTGAGESAGGNKVERITAWLSTQPSELGHSHLHDSAAPSSLGSDAQMGDSCDASGEYTTEDSDSSSCPSDSEEHNSSIVTCHLQQSLSGGSKGVATGGDTTDLDTPMQERMPPLPFYSAGKGLPGSTSLLTPEEGIRRKWNLDDGSPQWRKWSANDLAQIKNAGDLELVMWSLSKSDGALNCPVPFRGSSSRPKCSVRVDKSSDTMSRWTGPGASSAGETGSKNSISDCPSRHAEGLKASRRRDIGRMTPKSRKQPHWGSTSLTKTLRRRSGNLRKSRSFSGHMSSRTGLANKDFSFSDPQATNVEPVNTELAVSSVDLAAEAERMVVTNVVLKEEEMPVVASAQEPGDEVASQVEETSSMSEQAWDPYQAPVFFDENYSESGMDTEAVRKLLEWDDYRNFLDSLSDATSSVPPTNSRRRVSAGHGQYQRPPRRRKALKVPFDAPGSGDSDSDLDGTKVWNESTSPRKSSNGARPSDLGADSPNVEFVGKLIGSRTSSYQNGVGNSPAGVRVQGARNLKVMKELSPAKFEKYCKCEKARRDLDKLKLEMQDVDAKVRAFAMCDSVSNRQDLGVIVQKLKACLGELGAQKQTLVALNLDVHFLGTSGGPDEGNSFVVNHLKDLVHHLYTRWDDIEHLAGSSLSRMERAYSEWEEWDWEYADLMGTANDDKESMTAAVPVDALEQKSSAEKLSSVSGGSVAESVLRENKVEPKSTVRGCRKRNKRLGMDHLDDREARMKLIEEKAKEIVEMLPAKSAASRFFHEALDHAAEFESIPATRKPSVRGEKTHLSGKDSGSKLELKLEKIAQRKRTDARKQRSVSWGSRVMRTALPLQMALLAVIWIAFLIEPKCCDPSSSFGAWFSFSPLVKYTHGPPPS